MQAEQKKRSKARKESQKAPSRFEEEKEKRGLLDKYDEEEEEAAMLIGDQGQPLRSSAFALSICSLCIL